MAGIPLLQQSVGGKHCKRTASVYKHGKTSKFHITLIQRRELKIWLNRGLHTFHYAHFGLNTFHGSNLFFLLSGNQPLLYITLSHRHLQPYNASRLPTYLYAWFLVQHWEMYQYRYKLLLTYTCAYGNGHHNNAFSSCNIFNSKVSIKNPESSFCTNILYVHVCDGYSLFCM